MNSDGKKKRRSKTKFAKLVIWMQEHRELWLGWSDDWTTRPPFYGDSECARIWKACVKALKVDKLVCPTSHAADINIAKLIRAAQAKDYVKILVDNDGN